MDIVVVVVIIVAVIGGLGALFLFGSLRMRKLVRDGRGIMFADIESATASFSSSQEAIPGPVAKFLAVSGATRGPPVSSVHLRQTGAIRINEKSGWSKMRAEQWFSAVSPAFVWHAKASPFPLLWIEARDSLLRGKGGMIIRLLSLFTVADARGPEMDISSLIRYGSEMPWFPSSLRPSATVTWEGIDDRSARMILHHGSLSVSMVFTFSDEGEITRLDTSERFGDNHQKQPWVVRYADYKDVDGFRIPTSGEAAWETANGEFVYIKIRISEIQYTRSKS